MIGLSAMDWLKRIFARNRYDGDREVIDRVMAQAIQKQGETREWMAARGFRLVYDPITYRPDKDFDRNREYQFMRDGWDTPVLMRMADTHPAMNVCGLYYRP